jgi:hypothetical protein
MPRQPVYRLTTHQIKRLSQLLKLGSAWCASTSTLHDFGTESKFTVVRFEPKLLPCIVGPFFLSFWKLKSARCSAEFEEGVAPATRHLALPRDPCRQVLFPGKPVGLTSPRGSRQMCRASAAAILSAPEFIASGLDPPLFCRSSGDDDFRSETGASRAAARCIV